MREFTGESSSRGRLGLFRTSHLHSLSLLRLGLSRCTRRACITIRRRRLRFLWRRRRGIVDIPVRRVAEEVGAARANVEAVGGGREADDRRGCLEVMAERLPIVQPPRADGAVVKAAEQSAALGGEAKELKLKLPPSGSALNWTALPGFISAGDDLATLPAGTPLADAQKACAAMPRCLGYTYHAACGPTVPGNVTIKLKGSLHSGGGADWCRVAKPPKLDGVFLENVETLTSAEWSA